MNKKIVIVVIFILGFVLIVSGFSLNILSNKETSSKKDKKEKTPVVGENVGVVNKNNLKENADGTLSNSSEKITKKHVNGDFSIDDMSITVNKDQTDFASYKFTLKNNGTKDYQAFEVSIAFIFKDGTVNVDAPHKVDNLAASGSIELQRVVLGSIANAVDYEIRIKTNE